MYGSLNLVQDKQSLGFEETLKAHINTLFSFVFWRSPCIRCDPLLNSQTDP